MKNCFRDLATFAVAVAVLLIRVPTGVAQDVPAPDEFRTFDADLGQAWIDVSAYPAEQQQAYALFSRKCSKCHTLARPINSTLLPDQWIAYVNRMSRKPGAGINPKEVEVILGFLIFDSERRKRTAGAVDPALLPFLSVSRELSGVDRFPASLMDIRPENGSIRVRVEGDRRLDLSRLVASDEGQELVRWTRRAPHRGEIIVREIKRAGAPPAAAEDPGPCAIVLESAQEAVGEESDPTERVELLLDWLDEEMTREYVPGTAPADEILAGRRGDATEFASLFVALARAIGTPARTRVGLVAHRTAFYFHAWAEVWLDGWVAVDPYLGQLPADPTHIRLATPDGEELTDWDADSVPGLDRLQLRIVASESGNGGEEG